MEKPLLGCVGAEEELGLGEEALNGVGLLACAGERHPGLVGRVGAQRAEEALDGERALGQLWRSGGGKGGGWGAVVRVCEDDHRMREGDALWARKKVLSGGEIGEVEG